jgi:hypothetical protein
VMKLVASSKLKSVEEALARGRVFGVRSVPVGVPAAQPFTWATLRASQSKF